jgi:hypothetical protein
MLREDPGLESLDGDERLDGKYKMQEWPGLSCTFMRHGGTPANESRVMYHSYISLRTRCPDTKNSFMISLKAWSSGPGRPGRG